MKRLTWIVAPAAAVLIATLYWAHAQPAPAPIASLFPSGAMLYLEAKNFNALLTDWNASTEQKTWLDSDNYAVFSRSHLYTKLANAQTQFASAAGVPPDYALLTSVAGTNSAVAIYDIGKMEFLYISKLPSARALNTALWKARGTYQTRHAGNADYYIKEDKPSHRVAAFAYAGDTLLLATKESVLAGALQLMAKQNVPAVAAEPWFVDSVKAAAPGPSDLRLVYNMASLSRTFQFRSYWIQGNVSELREFSSGLTDLERARGEIRERRVLLRATAGPQAEAETATGQLLASVPDDASFYRAWLRPSGAQASNWVDERMFPKSAGSGPKSKAAPMAGFTSNPGSEEDLESRIDERPLTEDRDAMKPLRDKLLAQKIEAMLEVSSTKVDADQVYVRPHSAIALLSDANWDAAGIRTALGAVAQATWSQSEPAAWKAVNSVSELDGVGKLSMIADGKWLIIGDTTEMVAAVYARRTRPAIAGAVYAAGWKHARELPNFARMTKLIDFPQLPTAAAPEDPQAGGVEPQFFSENLASLGTTLKRVDAATIVIHDAGTMLREAVVYKLNP